MSEKDKCEYLWINNTVERCTHNKNTQPAMRLDGEVPGFCSPNKCPLKQTEYQTLMEVHLETIKKYQEKTCEWEKLKLKVSELKTLLEVAEQEIKELMGDKID